jgi:Secretion system C-terminal sorting domain
MKQLYSGALAVLTLCFLSFTSSAQTGGTYIAIQPGDWHTASGPGIWAAAEPPQNCPNCAIILNVTGTINLNTTINLSNSSTVTIGGAGHVTQLLIGNSSASGFANSFSIILANDGSNSTIQFANSGATLDASGAGTYDGLFTSFPSGPSTTFFKQVGNKPNGFVNNTIASNNAPAQDQFVGPATLSSSGNLPIILGDFNATVDNGSVNLAWTTELEINSEHFLVQSSTNAGSGWTTLATVAAAGNSASPINYSYVDGHPANGTTEFRLVMVDRDGKLAYSAVKAIRIGSIASVNVYPNPASDIINVTLTGEASASANIRVVNLSGQVLMEKNVTNAGGTTVALTVSSFPAGNYLVVIAASDGTKQVNKILIAK